MKRSILIDVESQMSSVALLEDGRLNEFHIEYKENNRLTGNIYKGKVENVLQGLESAFINVGLGRNGFLNVGEMLDDRTDLKRVMPGAFSARPGEYVMVQVIKEEVGQKGARLTANISLPGRYVVFLPTIDFVGISNKITDPARRDMLTKLLQKHKPAGGGLIARTVCIDAKKSDILAEIKRMQALYEKIRADYEAHEGVGLVHSEADLVNRSVRDMLSSDVEHIICNDADTVQRLKAYFESMHSDFYQKVSYYESDYDIWDVFGIGDEVDKLLERRVHLSGGGSLVIDRTEALTAIDVNTGSFYAGSDREETVYLTNAEAAKEIARQLRLRNIGGIIVVDFIDMVSEEHKAAVVEILRNEVIRDRIKTRVQDMTQLGLVEITRKKVGKELSTKLLDACEHCKGGGVVPNGDYVSRKLKSALKKLFAENDFANAIVQINAHVAERVLSGRYFSSICQNEWKDKRIYLIPNALIKPLAFVVSGNNEQTIDLPPTARLLY